MADTAILVGERLHIDECILRYSLLQGDIVLVRKLYRSRRDPDCKQSALSAGMGRRVAAWTSRSLTLELLDT